MPTTAKLSASAVIIRNNHILLIEFQDPKQGHYFNLPGGGVKEGESLIEALRREVLEETGVHLETIGPQIATWEYEPIRLANRYGKAHKIGFVFVCTLRKLNEPHLAKTPDNHQVGVRWLPCEQLPHTPLHPMIGRELLDALNRESQAPFYFLVS